MRYLSCAFKCSSRFCREGYLIEMRCLGHDEDAEEEEYDDEDEEEEDRGRTQVEDG